MASPHHIKSLDGLRAIAIILVLLWHSSQTIWYAYGQLFPIGGWDIGVIFRNGWIGVDLFFVLSGFLITKTFVQTDVKGFFIRRALKIFPAYYVSILAYCCVIAVVTTHFPIDLFGIILPQLVFLNDYMPENLNGPLWSVAVEVKFYLLAPLLLMAAFKSTLTPRVKVVLMFLLAITLPLAARLLAYDFHASDFSTYNDFFLNFRKPFPLNIEGILLGVTIGLLDRQGGITISKKAANIIYTLGLVGLVVILTWDIMLGDFTLYDITFQPIVNALIMAALVLGCVKGAGHAWLESRPMEVMAKVSYSLYVVHFPIVIMFKKPFNDATLDLALSPLCKYGLYLVPFLLITSLATYLMYHYVEKPFLKLKPAHDKRL